MSFQIERAAGVVEEFDAEKLKKSLEKAGSHRDLTDKIIAQIYKLKPKTSTEIYNQALQMLSQEDHTIASRYNLKRALFELGPAGFPFEKFVAEIFRAMGYETKVGQIVAGKCVSHEVDIILKKDNEYEMVECKFHTTRGVISDVKVPLYVKARFDDIVQAVRENIFFPLKKAWLVTNTRLSHQAVAYGQCINLNMLAWNYPHDSGLEDVVIKYGVHPITALTQLTSHQKKELIKEGHILCANAQEFRPALKRMGFDDAQIEKLIHESESVCKT